ncbi:MAG: amidohydrolase family protein [Acidimicrobiales bacterium]|nr:amidohydrolase family protein [Acidimicrobiales bacterium]
MAYVDAHVHFWDDGIEHGWLDGEPALPSRATLADYRDTTVDDPPSRFLFVEADADEGMGAAEARWVADMCGGEADFAGMVVWAPVQAGGAAVARHLDELGLDGIVGIRRLVQGEAAGFARSAGFVDGVRAVGAADLVFDICITANQFADAIALARAAPDTRLVLDHCGKPPIATGQLADWRRDLAALAASENVTCKLSGLVTEADPQRWSEDELAPVLDHALECFGAERILWGSDWPVVERAATHRSWRDATDILLAPLSDDERDTIRRTTALRIYDLEDDTP